VILRGPLGVGKTTIARRLARSLDASYISVDRVLDRHDLIEFERNSITLGSFLAANRVIASRYLDRSRRRRWVVVDGNFYWMGQIRDLRRRVRAPSRVFTLEAPVEVCIERDRRRARSYGVVATRRVFELTNRVHVGEAIDATAPPSRIVRTILARLAD
jgi:tRNA uridine 5-carbamoylmethylation protein Kti12